MVGVNLPKHQEPHLSDIGSHAPRPHFSRPLRQVVLMLIVIALVTVGVLILLPQVMPVFLGNPALNGFIFAVFIVGVLSCFWQVAQLMRSVQWIERFTTSGMAQDQVDPPQLLAPLATLMRSRGEMQLTATSTRSILDSVGTRVEEDREITRYIVNTLIFLGLLGTFYGLATTVPALVDTIRSLAPQGDEPGLSVFNRLMTGLEEQLSGMGTAFASSLLGLAGSLVVGLLELFASHGQNRFYRELEEWLSSITRLGIAGVEEGASDREVIIALVTEMSHQMEAMQEAFLRADATRAEADMRVAQTFENLIKTQQETAEQMADGGMDAESRMRLRSMDVQLMRILEELSAGREESTAALRDEMSRLGQSLGRKAGRSSPLGD